MSRLFDKEQHAFLLSIAEGRTSNEIAKLISDKFSLNITPRQIRTYKKNHNIKSNITTRFEKGHQPQNKGSKGLYNVGGNSTSFKPGHKPKNYKPIGYERIDRDGYLLVKVSDEGPWDKRWRHKHKVIWERENGKIPVGHALLFADQNKLNVKLDNLVLISKQQLQMLNKKKLLHKDAELNKTGILVADLLTKISSRSKKGGKENVSN